MTDTRMAAFSLKKKKYYLVQEIPELQVSHSNVQLEITIDLLEFDKDLYRLVVWERAVMVCAVPPG